MAKKTIPFDEYKQIYSRVPRLCVDVILRTPNGVALLKRANGGWEGMWHFPGSMVLLNESLEDALHRTALEEAGVKIKVVKFLDHMEFHDEVEHRGYGYSVSAAYLCDLVEGTLTHDEDSLAVETFKEIPDNFISQQRELLKQHWDEIKTAW